MTTSILLTDPPQKQFEYTYIMKISTILWTKKMVLKIPLSWEVCSHTIVHQSCVSEQSLWFVFHSQWTGQTQTLLSCQFLHLSWPEVNIYEMQALLSILTKPETHPYYTLSLTKKCWQKYSDKMSLPAPWWLPQRSRNNLSGLVLLFSTVARGQWDLMSSESPFLFSQLRQRLFHPSSFCCLWRINRDE